MSHILGTDTL